MFSPDELLSALRGGADVNGDRVIEYSELHAFLSAANRDVTDDRAKLSVVVQAPRLNERMAVVRIDQLSQVGFLALDHFADGRFSIEDDRGVRVLDVHPEPGMALALALPAGRLLSLRAEMGEAALQLRPGERVDLASLSFGRSTLRARDALAAALHRGLFHLAHGPIYYRGFVDSSGELSVDFSASAPPIEPVPRRVPLTRRVHTAYGLWGGAGALALGAGVLGIFWATTVSAYNATDVRREAVTLQTRYQALEAATLTVGAVALLVGTAGFAVFPWAVRPAAAIGPSQMSLSLAGEW